MNTYSPLRFIAPLLALGLTLLHYDLSFGLNAAITTIALGTFCFFSHPDSRKRPSWWAFFAMNLLAATGVLITGTYTAIICTVVLWPIVLGSAISPKYSVYSAFLSQIASPIIRMSDKKLNRKWDTSPHLKQQLMVYLVPTMVAILFAFVYTGSNLIVQSWWENIILQRLSAGFIFLFLAIWAYLALSGTDLPNPHFIFAEKATPNKLQAGTEANKTLVSGAINLFLLLNGLLLFFNSVDVFYLYFQQELPEGIAYHEYVHHGIYSLIFSILMAVGVILGVLNEKTLDHSKLPKVKLWAYVWVAQNLLLVLNTVQKNSLYVGEYGLTEKRIGVYVYLVLCLVGLTVTAYKIAKDYSWAFLLRRNAIAFLWVWAMATWVPYSQVITWYNLSYISKPNLDLNYLISLDNSNSAILLSHPNLRHIAAEDPVGYRIRQRAELALDNARQKSWPEMTVSSYRLGKQLEGYLKKAGK